MSALIHHNGTTTPVHMTLDIDTDNCRYSLEGTKKIFKTLNELLNCFEQNPLSHDIRELGKPCIPPDNQHGTLPRSPTISIHASGSNSDQINMVNRIFDELSRQREEYKKEIEKYREQHKKEIEIYREEHKKEIEIYREDHKKEIEIYREDHKKEVEIFREELEKEKEMSREIVRAKMKEENKSQDATNDNEKQEVAQNEENKTEVQEAPKGRKCSIS